MFINYRTIKRIFVIFSLLLLLNGCGSLVGNFYQKDTYYAGVQKDFEFMKKEPLIIPLAVVDLPLSFIADTLIIPLVLYCHNHYVGCTGGVDYSTALTNKPPVEVELDKYRQALRNNEEKGNKQGMVVNYRDMGAEYYKHGYSEKSVKMYQKALELDQALGIKEEIATDYRLQGEVYNSDKKFDKAIEMYNKVLEIHQVLGIKKDIANDYNVLGVIYFSLKEFDKAIELFNKALEINQALGAKEGMALDYRNLGETYKQKGNKVEAASYYQKSIELYKQMGNPTANDVQTELNKLTIGKF